MSGRDPDVPAAIARCANVGANAVARILAADDVEQLAAIGAIHSGFADMAHRVGDHDGELMHLRLAALAHSCRMAAMAARIWIDHGRDVRDVP